MSKRSKPSRRRASLGIIICFAAAVVMMGTYSVKTYQKAKQETQEKTGKDAKETKKEPTESANTDRLVIDTDEEEREKDSSTAENGTESEGQEADQETAPVPGGGTSAGALSAASGQGTSLNFTEESELLWPVNGQILMNYSMDKTVYFSTLDQYKYNPAVIISGAEGDQVIGGAAGLVKSIDVTAQTGTTVNLDLGNGYELFIGQLKEVPVNAGDYVDANTVIGYVSKPTKYYAVEGCNVYYEMRKDGQPTDPLQFMSE